MAKRFNAKQSCLVKIPVCTSAAIMIVVIFFQLGVQSPLDFVQVQGGSQGNKGSSKGRQSLDWEYAYSILS